MIYFDKFSFGIFQSDIKIFKDEIVNTIEKHFGYMPENLKIRYSKKMTLAMGKISINQSANKFVISLSYVAREKFGLDRVIKTFRHELAHYAAWKQTGKLNHDIRFKNICKLFDGSMNSQMSTGEFSSCHDGRYLAGRGEYSYEYKCRCGANNFKRKKRVSKHMHDRICPHCKTRIRDMEVKL